MLRTFFVGLVEGDLLRELDLLFFGGIVLPVVRLQHRHQPLRTEERWASWSGGASTDTVHASNMQQIQRLLFEFFSYRYYSAYSCILRTSTVIAIHPC